MKLALVGDYPLNKAYGGVGQYIYCLAAALAKYHQDIDVKVLTYSDRKYAFQERNFVVYTVARNNKIPRVLTIYQDAVSMEEEIRRINPDVVHISGTYYPYSYLGQRILSVYPLLATLHAYAGHEIWYLPANQRINGLVSYLLENRLLKRLDNVVVCSTYMEQLVARKTSAHIFVIPNGVDDHLFHGPIPTLEDNIKHPSILFLGRLEKIKGIEVLIMAIPEIRKSIPDLQVYLAGEGHEKKSIEKLIQKLNIENSVTLLGNISGAKKFAYLKNTDLFVAPSYQETFGLSVLEAMEYGKAIVASNTGNMPYFIKDGIEGLLCEPGDCLELAKKCIYILLNQEFARNIGAKAMLKAEEYTWNNTADLIYQAYKKILSQ
jgi:glycosyltransferase involved in cell wall biosynthesis